MIHHGIDHARFSPGDEPREPFLLYPGPAVAAQEPRRGCTRRSRCSAASGRSCGSCSPAAGTAGAAPDGVEVRGNVTLDELVSLYRRAAALVFPSLLRGLRPAAARGDGLRLPGRLLERRVAARGVRRRGARTSTPDDAGAIAEAVADVLDDPESWAEQGAARASGFTWKRSAALHEDVYRELLDVA